MLGPRLALSLVRFAMLRWLRWRAQRAANCYLALSRRADRILAKERAFFGLPQGARRNGRPPDSRSAHLGSKAEVKRRAR